MSVAAAIMKNLTLPAVLFNQQQIQGDPLFTDWELVQKVWGGADSLYAECVSVCMCVCMFGTENQNDM